MPDGDITLTVSLDTKEIKAQIADLTKDLQNMAKSASGGGMIQEFKQITSVLETVSRQVNQVVAQLNQMEASGGTGTTQYQTAQAQLAAYADELAIANARAQTHGAVAQEAGNKSNSAFNKASTSVNRYSRKTVSALDKIKRSAQRAFSFEGITRGIRKLAMMTIGVYSFTAALNKLKSIIKEGINNLIQFDIETNQTTQAMNEIQASLSYLKNAWGAAFAPILNFVQPALTALIDTLAALGNMLARLFGAIFGQSQVLQAVKKDAGGYADALDNVGSSAKKATDRLAAFDDLNVLGKDDDSAGGGGGGAGGGVGDMFEWVDVDPSEFEGILHWIDELKKKIKDSGLIEAIERFIQALKDSGFLELITKIIDTILETSFDTALAVLTDIFNIMTAILELDLEGFFNGLKDLTIDISFGPLETLAGVLDDILGTDFKPWITKAKEDLKDMDITEFPAFLDIKNAIDDIKTSFEELIEVVGGPELAQAFNKVISSEEAMNWWIEKMVAGFAGLINILLSGVAVPLQLIAGIVKIIADIIALIKLGVALIAAVIRGDWASAIDIVKEGVAKIFDTLSDILHTVLEPMLIIARAILSAIDGVFGTNWLGEMNAQLSEWEFNIENGIGALFGLEEQSLSTSGSLSQVTDLFDYGKESVKTWAADMLESTGIVGEGFGDVAVQALLSADGVEEATTRTGESLGANVAATSAWSESVCTSLDETATVWTDSLDNTMQATSLWGGSMEGILAGTTAVWDENTQSWIVSLEGVVDETGKVPPTVKGNFADMETSITESTDSLKSVLEESWGGLSISVPDDAMVLTDESQLEFSDFENTSNLTFTNIEGNVTSHMTTTRINATNQAKQLQTTLTTTWNMIKTETDKAFSAMSRSTISNFSAMATGIKAPANQFLTAIEGMVNRSIDAINSLFSAVRQAMSLGSAWLNYMGLPEISVPGNVSHVSIPRLAEGAVIPPNKEFLAVLGDQSHGTNIEAPLDTIKQAVAEVVGNSGNEEIIQLLQELIRVVESKDLTIGDKEIGKANARYVNKQNIIRGTSF